MERGEETQEVMKEESSEEEKGDWVKGRTRVNL